MDLRSHLLCCACRLNLATEPSGYANTTGRVTQFIVLIINQNMGYNIKKIHQKKTISLKSYKKIF